MQEVVSFFVAVAAGVTCHYIIKWLDSDKQPVTSLRVLSLIAIKIGIEKPQCCNTGAFRFVPYTGSIFFAYRHYSICKKAFQYTFLKYFINLYGREYRKYFRQVKRDRICVRVCLYKKQCLPSRLLHLTFAKTVLHLHLLFPRYAHSRRRN